MLFYCWMLHLSKVKRSCFNGKKNFGKTQTCLEGIGSTIGGLSLTSFRAAAFSCHTVMIAVSSFISSPNAKTTGATNIAITLLQLLQLQPFLVYIGVIRLKFQLKLRWTKLMKWIAIQKYDLTGSQYFHPCPLKGSQSLFFLCRLSFLMWAQFFKSCIVLAKVKNHKIITY